MIDINSLKIIRCTKLRPAHPLDTQAANRAYKETRERMTAQLKRELGLQA